MKNLSLEGIKTPLKGTLNSLDTLGIVTPPLKNKGLPIAVSTRLAYIKKQKAKAITMAQVYPLINLGGLLTKSYWRTYSCNSYIEQKGKTLKSNYCDARWCNVCNRVRMAKMINGYGTVILGLNDIYFVTLTAINVREGKVKSEIDRMLRKWVDIRKHISKYCKDLELKGMRKLECTYKPSTGFNPHFHIIISGKATAEKIIERWLYHFPNANRGGQDMRKANDGSLTELFKYTAKGVHKGKFYPRALDEIYNGLYYRKTYYPIGIKKYVDESIDGIQVQEVDFLESDNNIFEWNNEAKEWFDGNGISLTNHALDGDLFDWIESLEKNI
jgi:hypothetical protein